MMSDPIVRVQAEAPPVDVAIHADMPDAVVRIEVANQGKDGYTPKRGVDYWTEEDVQEIHDYVDEQIGTGGGGSGAVSSVNGKTGAVMLTPEDIGAQPKGDYALKKELPSVPTRLSQLEQDADHRLATDAEKAAWDAKSDFSGKYADLEGKPDIPQIDDAAVSAESTWSSKNTVERFLPEFTESGAAVECHPFLLCPLNVSTTFEPAQAGSGDPYPAGGGRNLLNPSEAMANGNFEHHGITGTWTDDGDVILNGTVTEGTWVSIGSFMTIAGERYWASVGETNATIAIWNRVAGAFATNVRRGSKANFVAADSGMHVCFINSVVGTTFTNERVKLMVNEGNDVLPWEPSINIRPISGYDSLELTLADKTENKNTYTVHLGDTVYGGTYDWSKGELVAEWKMVTFDGTENWFNMDNDGRQRFKLRDNFAPLTNSKVYVNGFCSHYKWDQSIDRQNATVRFAAVDDDTRNFYVCDNGISVANFVNDAVSTEFKAYLAEQYAAGTPVQIAYKLAEPITIQLAPLEIMPIDGTNVLISNPGSTTVSGKLDPIYLHEQNKTAAAKLVDMETRLRALESAAVNNA